MANLTGNRQSKPQAKRQVRRGPASSSSPSVHAFIVALTLAAVALASAGWANNDHWVYSDGQQAHWGTLTVLVLLGIVGASLRERELGPQMGVSMATVILAAALPLVGPEGAVVVGYLSYLGDLRRPLLRARFFNAAMTGCVGGIGGLVYQGVARLMTDRRPEGINDLDAYELMVQVALPLVAGYGAMTVLNAVIIGVLSHLVSGDTVRGAVRGVLQSLGIGYLLHALIAFLFVVLWGPAKVGAFSAVLILAPLLITQWTLSRDAEERRSHARTVGTIVAALEAANPYTVGHSARVATLCQRMAPRLGLRGEAAEELHFAALLHDIGLMAVSPRMPRVTGDVDVDYLVAISEHPEAGVRMLRDITFLDDALDGIRHHHERVDGRGYPSGLAGEDIPIFARMIAVADAFDSLTTTRSYRDAVDQDTALDMLRSRVGTHLDGAVVEALDEALEGRPWEPTEIDDSIRSTFGAAHDHDDPLVSDLYAEWSPDSEEVPG